MRKIARISVAAAIALGAGIGAAATARVAPPIGACRPAARLVCVTGADGGRTVRAVRGEAVEVELDSSSLSWGGLSERGPALRRVSLDVATPGVVLARYDAARVGTATLAATAVARCSRGQACPQFVLAWHVVVKVRG